MSNVAVEIHNKAVCVEQSKQLTAAELVNKLIEEYKE